jgi:hypothetical protein
MSIGYTSPINGSNTAFSIYAKNAKNAGGAIQGWMPQTTQLTDERYPEYEQIRFTLKNAWNNRYNSQLKNYNTKSVATPFRAVNNAGDLLGREQFSCGGSCQTPQSRPGLKGLKGHMGSITSNCSIIFATFSIITY